MTENVLIVGVEAVFMFVLQHARFLNALPCHKLVVNTNEKECDMTTGHYLCCLLGVRGTPGPARQTNCLLGVRGTPVPVRQTNCLLGVRGTPGPALQTNCLLGGDQM